MMDNDPGLRSSLAEALAWEDAAARYADITGSSPTQLEMGSESAPHHEGDLHSLREIMDELQRRAIGIPSWEPGTY